MIDYNDQVMNKLMILKKKQILSGKIQIKRIEWKDWQ